ncbi:MAG: hypothetical protein ONB24_13070 [candidate division KSB1 bacterium]|nr:hypothetical protein [candidate division KSB1 bacterium]
MRTVFTLLILFSSLLIAADVPRSLYVINGSAETLSMLNLETGEVRRDVVKTGQIPNYIFSCNNLLYVVNSGSSSLQIVDPRRNQVVKTILLKPNANPWAAAIVGRNKAYVSNWVDNSISIVDLEKGTLIGNLAVGKGPEGILVVDDYAFVCVTGYAGWGMPFETGNLVMIDTRTDQIVHILETPTNPQDAALAPDGRIHVLCTGDYAALGGKIAVVDLYTGPNWNIPAVVDTIDIGGSPGDLEITPQGKGYAVAWGDGVNGFLYSYNALTGTVERGANSPIAIGPNVSRLLYDGRENCLWIPFMSQWGGDGFVQKLNAVTGSIEWTSPVVGNGCQAACIVERIWEITPWADAVVSFTPGVGAGRGAQYFPDNVLGPPDQTPGLNEYSPSNRPQEVLSLGHGGEIVLEFVDNIIIDEPGPDFTVFENAFISLFDGQPFIEAGIVAVSQDGVNFHTFPYDLDTWKGLAGVTPTKDAYHFLDPDKSGGDSFDLADVGLKWAKYVKITDLGDLKQEGLWNGDFDLDAVVAVHYRQTTQVRRETDTPHLFALQNNYPNPFNSSTVIPVMLSAPQEIRLEVVDLNGRLTRRLCSRLLPSGEHRFAWDGRDEYGREAAAGVYFARLTCEESTQIIKMTLLR